MANNEEYYEWVDKVYPCDVSGICPGYGGCSMYPVCVGWTKEEQEEN